MKRARESVARMRLIFSTNAWEDYLYWQKADKKTVIIPYHRFFIRFLYVSSMKEAKYLAA